MRPARFKTVEGMEIFIAPNLVQIWSGKTGISLSDPSDPNCAWKLEGKIEDIWDELTDAFEGSRPQYKKL